MPLKRFRVALADWADFFRFLRPTAERVSVHGKELPR